MHRRHGAHATKYRGPATIPGTEGTSQDHHDRVAAEIQSATTTNAAFGDGVQVTADHQRNASRHRAASGKQAVMLLEPAGLPIRFCDRGRELAVGPENVRVPLAPLAGAPAWR